MAYRAMCDAAPGRRVRIDMDGERVDVAITGGEARVGLPAGQAAVRVSTSRRATVALVDAETTLVAAVESGAIEIVATPDDVVAFHDALHGYLHGAVRAPSFPDLLRQFRRSRAEGGMHT